MPPMLPPTTARRRPTPRRSSRRRWTSTMSRTVKRGKLGPYGARRRVERRRSGGAVAAAEDVAADDEVLADVERLAGTDQRVPPARHLALAVPPRGVRRARQRVADEHRVVAAGVELAVGLVGHRDVVEAPPELEPQRVARASATSRTCGRTSPTLPSWAPRCAPAARRGRPRSRGPGAARPTDLGWLMPSPRAARALRGRPAGRRRLEADATAARCRGVTPAARLASSVRLAWVVVHGWIATLFASPMLASCDTRRSASRKRKAPPGRRGRARAPPRSPRAGPAGPSRGWGGSGAPGSGPATPSWPSSQRASASVVSQLRAHAQLERLQPLQRQEGGERRQRGAEREEPEVVDARGQRRGAVALDPRAAAGVAGVEGREARGVVREACRRRRRRRRRTRRARRSTWSRSARRRRRRARAAGTGTPPHPQVLSTISGAPAACASAGQRGQVGHRAARVGDRLDPHGDRRRRPRAAATASASAPRCVTARPTARATCGTARRCRRTPPRQHHRAPGRANASSVAAEAAWPEAKRDRRDAPLERRASARRRRRPSGCACGVLVAVRLAGEQGGACAALSNT
jgi:hypothetical protein